MAIIGFPRDVLSGVDWRQTGGRSSIQRSTFGGQSKELADFGPAPRWQARCEPVAMWDDHQRRDFNGFEAACQVPGNVFRLPATEASQYGESANIVQNPDLDAGISGWGLPASTARIADEWPSPVLWFFRADPGAARSITANNDAVYPAAPSTPIFLQSWAYRSDAGATANLAIQFLNASMTVISTGTLVLSPTVGSWALLRGSVTPPALTAYVKIRYDLASWATGYMGLSGALVSLSPPAGTVNGAGQTGRTLAMSGLAPSRTNLHAGQMVTVTLPGGDEQLIRLASDLVADGSGNATAALATPLRNSPANGAAIELGCPWGLMRATHVPGWSVNSQNIYAHDLDCEEAF